MMAVMVMRALVASQALSSSLTAPTFRVEPPPRVLFSNKYGTVIPCVIDSIGYTTSASYVTNLKITWMSVMDNNEGHHSYVEVNDVIGLRLTRDDGSLCLLPFAESLYSDHIHDTIYVCVANTPYGVIGSRLVKVKAGLCAIHFIPICIIFKIK